MCLSHLIYRAALSVSHFPCHAPNMPFFSRSQHSTAVERRPCCGFEKNGMVGAWYGHGMASVNQTRPYCANQMGKPHSKSLAARHAMCESAFTATRVWFLGMNLTLSYQQSLGKTHPFFPFTYDRQWVRVQTYRVHNTQLKLLHRTPVVTTNRRIQ